VRESRLKYARLTEPSRFSTGAMAQPSIRAKQCEVRVLARARLGVRTMSTPAASGVERRTTEGLHHPAFPPEPLPQLSIHKQTPPPLHPTPYTLRPTPYTLHPTPYTLHPSPYALHPTTLPGSGLATSRCCATSLPHPRYPPRSSPRSSPWSRASTAEGCGLWVVG